ncbi:hypothetical protein [Aquabacterium sp. NJ1]|uniref:hypothetical protein n=1 Tax=Aquabacterium sp. NJ1 TaxID=1538295 RepID=UPI00068C76B1|nr:hypothetical protein [Aquabacterium sp. NJ1]
MTRKADPHSTASLLLQGGDERLDLDPALGVNKYGCRPTPDPDLAAFGSSTASSVSRRGFAAADQLRRKLMAASPEQPAAQLYQAELQAIREELLTLCDLGDLPEPDVLFAASGTDLHLIATHLVTRRGQHAPMVIMMDPTETGSGVTNALRMRHFGRHTAQGRAGTVGAPVKPAGQEPQLVQVALRQPDGQPRPQADVHAEIETWVRRAVLAGQAVLLVTLDVSKTGMLAPGPGFAISLKQQWPDTVTVLVDASQFRLSGATLSAYLRQGCLVAVTGSKFLTGPSFCGALFVPAAWPTKRGTPSSMRALSGHCARADWPAHWPDRHLLPDTANFGLLLRWKAALAELRAFKRIPQGHTRHLLRVFGNAIQRRLDSSETFESLATHGLGRPELNTPSSWDTLPTIFSFVLYGADAEGRRTPLTRAQTQRVYHLLQTDLSDICPPDAPAREAQRARTRCQLGQPVPCGTRQGVPVSALRLSISSRLVVEALSGSGSHAERVLQRAMLVLDKAEWLLQSSTLIYKEDVHAI